MKEGKDICMSFRQEESALIVRTVWWNVDAKIRVHEWGVAIPIEPTRLTYQEAHGHYCEGKDAFPGIAGEGHIWLNPDNTLSLSQTGLLCNGSSAGFTTLLVKV